MRCPRCPGQLATESLGGKPALTGGPYRSVANEAPLLASEAVQVILVDRCLSCGGIWFDEGEMTDAIRRMKLRELPTLPQGRASKLSTSEPVGPCPRCGASMKTRTSRAVPDVEYDRCRRCHGVWFDAGEAEQFGDEHVGLLALMLDEFS